MKKNKTILSVLFSLLAFPLCAGEVELRSHDALYAMKQVRQQGQNWSMLERADGVLRYKFRNTCEGWAVEHHSAMHMDYENNQQAQMTWSYASWESHDGKRLRFRSRMKRNGVINENHKGEARIESDKSVAIYAEPNGRREVMPSGVLFPTSHLLYSLKQAQAGETVFSTPYFDGSGEVADYDVDTVMTRYKGKPLLQVEDQKLEKLPAWDMQLAFHLPQSQSSVAEMEISARYRLDGVSTRLIQDYGDFVLEGKLVELTYMDEPVCD
ncbi:conserved exported hypothetical protein [Candidatus Terasakiella magnetica]|uniref:DUF1849 family protein n=1 Tax=Candidatus Terasakiella magnetica TaxID=1867952 RepID=A0A1C3RK50_9PROT|nr:DUF1849 family protein [Candidatus Terasakiella magnetica]SCA57670.1 conserved exported hypothetical protein [Candidatus Terasakiella magnetica]